MTDHKRPPRRRSLDRVLHDPDMLAALEMSLAEALRQPEERDDERHDNHETETRSKP